MRHIIKIQSRLLLSVMGIVFIAVMAFSLYLLLNRGKTVELPKPTGPYAVGRVGYDWEDTSRNEAFIKTNNKRKLTAWIWYPADNNQTVPKVEYFPGMWRTVQEEDQGVPFLQQDLRKIQTNSSQGLALSNRQLIYPVVIFEPGMGKIVFNYQVLAVNLASHGYVVVGINPTYSSDYVIFLDGSVAYKTPEGSMPEGNPTDEQLNDVGSKLVEVWSGDMRFAIDKLDEMNTGKEDMWTRHIDMENIGVFGHSFGGAASVEACSIDKRIKAGIDIDGYLYGVDSSPNTPFMFIMSQYRQSDIDLKEINQIKRIYGNLRKDSYLIEINEASHYNFEDDVLFFSPILRAMRIFGTINGERGLRITNTFITAFFDKYLKNINCDLLTKGASDYPEVNMKYR